MVRPLRIEFKNAYYHVMNRGRGRKTIYPGKSYYQAFLQGLEEANQRFGLDIQAYCLMGNHYHLLVKTPRGNLSRCMRHVNGLYTQRYNRLKRTDGPLFRGRYKAILVDSSEYLLQVSRYIHRNPIETKKPLVRKLEKYPWSSYAAYVNKIQIPAWLNREDVYGGIGGRQPYLSYASFVDAGNDLETEKFYNRKELPSIWGDKAFCEIAYAKSDNWSREVARKGYREPIDSKQVVKHVANYYTCDEQSIYKATRGRGQKNIPRWVAMKLVQDYSDKTLNQLAVLFCVGHYCTVSQTIARLVKLMEVDEQLKKQVIAICKDLTP